MKKQISAIISLKDNFSKPLLKMSDNVKSLTKDTRNSMNQVNRWGKQVERTVDRAIKAAVKWGKRGAILFGGWSLKKGIDGISEMDTAARKVKSIARDRLNFDDIKDDIWKMSFDTGESFEKLGDTMYNAISASVPIEIIEEVTRLSHKLSVGGFTNVDDAMRLLATTANAFGFTDISDYNRMADQFLKTQELGVIEVEEMVKGYGSINTLSNVIGSSLEEQNAAIATMTALSMTDTEAITAYKNILNAFLKPVSDTTAAALENLGLGADFLTAKSFKKHGFGGVIKKVMEATKGDLDEISKIFKDIRGKTGATIFAGEGLDKFFYILGEIEKAEGSTEDAFKTVSGSIEYQWNLLKRKIDSINTLFYEDTGFGRVISESLQDLNNWIDDNLDLILEKLDRVGEIVVGIVRSSINLFKVLRDNKDILKLLGSFLFTMYSILKISDKFVRVAKNFKYIKTAMEGMKLGQIIKGVSLGKLAIVAAAILFSAKVIKYLYDNWDDLMERYPTVQNALDRLSKWAEESKPFLEGVGDAFAYLGNIIVHSIGFAVKSVAETIMATMSMLAGLFKAVIGIVKILVGIFKGDLDLIKEGATEFGEGVSEMWRGLMDLFFDPITGVLELIDNDIFDGIKEIGDAWDSLKIKMSNPIKTGVEIAKTGYSYVEGKVASKMEGFHSNRLQRPMNYPQNYKGTPNWRGGITQINERGGEFVDLPSGSRIYPHDKSLDMAFNKGANSMIATTDSGVNINFGDIVFTGDIKGYDDVNKLGTDFTETVINKLKNM